VFPVRYELNFYIVFRRNSVLKGLISLITSHITTSWSPKLPHQLVFPTKILYAFITAATTAICDGYQMSRSNGQNSGLTSGWSRVRMSDRKLAMLTGLRGSLRPLQTNSRIVLKLGHDRFLPNPFQLIIHQSSTKTQSDTLTER
jgi:hypothetical protein